MGIPIGTDITEYYIYLHQMYFEDDAQRHHHRNATFDDDCDHVAWITINFNGIFIQNNLNEKHKFRFR